MVTMDFSAVAHDLRGPLNVMLGQMQLMSREQLSDRVRERLSVVEAQARRLVRLLESCDKEPSASHFARVDLTSVIGDAVAELDAVFERQGIEIAATTDPDLPGLLGDGDLLHRVLINLLTNAADSIDGAGCIQIEAHVNRAGRERASIDIHISDTGGGIPADLVPRVFDYGFTTKTSTTPRGLGLSICREIIEMHGGRIALSSDRGRGTTVRVSLPAKA